MSKLEIYITSKKISDKQNGGDQTNKFPQTLLFTNTMMMIATHVARSEIAVHEIYHPTYQL